MPEEIRYKSETGHLNLVNSFGANIFKSLFFINSISVFIVKATLVNGYEAVKFHSDITVEKSMR